MSFFEELKRRRVFRVAVAYVVIGWLLAQVADLALGAFEAPAWVLKAFLLLLALGFPVALVLSWAYQLTPEGLERDAGANDDEPPLPVNGVRTDRIVMGVIAAIVALVLFTMLYPDEVRDPGEEVATAGRRSIAVLPFVNMSEDDDYFADGLTEELMNVLAKNQDLRVAGRTSSFAFKGLTPNFREVGDALGVDHVLEGSVRRSGERIRVTAQLVKVEDGFHVWSDTYDRKLTDIFEIQDDVAGAISQELNLRLAPAADRPTNNPDAYALYLQALAAFRTEQYTEQDILDRIGRIMALDPAFAKAAELKAIAYWNLGANSLDNPTARGRIHDAANAALKLDPELVIARTLADISVPGVLRWAPEFRAVERAIDRLPDDFSLLGIYRYELLMAGYYRDALSVARRMVDMEPLAHGAHDSLANSLMATGNEAEAYRQWRRAAELGGDRYLIYIAWGNVIAGDLDSAVGPLEKAWSVPGLDPADARPFLEAASDPDNGKTFLDGWIKRHVTDDHDIDSITTWYPWYLAFGCLDDYFRIIERYQAETDTTWTNADTLEGLGMAYTRSGYLAHPAFMARNRRFSIPEIWEVRGPPDRCSRSGDKWVCE